MDRPARSTSASGGAAVSVFINFGVPKRAPQEKWDYSGPGIETRNVPFGQTCNQATG